MSLDAFPVDPALPQLRIASDPALMLDVFRRHLRPLNGRACRIEDCRVSRVRYRWAARCVLQYSLRLVDAGTGREQLQWVTGVVYPGNRTERIWRRLQAAAPGREITGPAPIFGPASFISDLGMLVEVFPFDRRLPHLPRLLSSPPPELERLLLLALGPGDWHRETLTIEPVRYRAELGAVVRYAVQARDGATGRGEAKRFYVKAYADEHGARTYRALQALHDRTEAGREPFTFGRPVAYLSDLRALVQEEVSGTPLDQIMLEDRDTVTAVRQVARDLAVFNQDAVAIPWRSLPQDETAGMERAANLLRWACPRLSAEVEAVVVGAAAGLRDAPRGPAHGDLKAEHFLLEGGRTALLDLDSFTLADPVLDPAAVLAQLSGLRFRYPIPHDRLRMATRTFAEEYFARVPDAWRTRLRFHYAVATLKVAVGFFRRQEPRWPDTIAAMVQQARDSLAGRIW